MLQLIAEILQLVYFVEIMITLSTYATRGPRCEIVLVLPVEDDGFTEQVERPSRAGKDNPCIRST